MNLNNLNFPFDYILLTIIFIIILFCCWKGFIQSILSLLTWIGSILITVYAYESLAGYLTKQLLNIDFFQKYDYLSNIGSILITIPLIFLGSLFILKRVRKFLSSDLDKQVLGIFFDKVFGLIYGVIFSYLLISTMLIILKRFDFDLVHKWANNNSNIVLIVENFNSKYVYLNETYDDISD